MLVGGNEAWQSVFVVAVEDISLGGDDEGLRVELVLEDASRYRSLVVGTTYGPALQAALGDTVTKTVTPWIG